MNNVPHNPGPRKPAPTRTVRREIHIHTMNATNLAADTPFMPDGKPAPFILLMSEAAALLRCSERTIRDAVKGNKLRPIDGTKHFRFTLEEIKIYAKKATETGIG